MVEQRAVAFRDARHPLHEIAHSFIAVADELGCVGLKTLHRIDRLFVGDVMWWVLSRPLRMSDEALSEYTMLNTFV